MSGLLGLLKSIQKPCTLKKFAGQTVGIDAYGWLHRGTVACAIELALDRPTSKYIDFAVNKVRMLLDFGVTPYLVFDGDALPSKAGTNAARRKRRDESKALGLELYKDGKIAQAYQELQKAAAVTPSMARELIEELKRMDVQYIVAPYEADAQLVYLEQKGIINGILSEDSDLLVFGAKRLLTKLDKYGECVEIERSDFTLCKEISLAGWTDAMFRRMAILSGCDYVSSIDRMGLKTAYRFVRKYKEAEKTIRMIQFEGKLFVPVDYLSQFQNAELTFIHHRVFCPIQQEMVFLNDLPRHLKEQDLPFLGHYVDAETAIGVACGDLDPRTKQSIDIGSTVKRRISKEDKRQTAAAASDLKPKKSIDSFFTIKRQPLAELDPNSLTPSPSQQRLLQQHRNTSWEPRTVSSAPQLRRTATDQYTKSTIRTDRNAFLARASTVSTYQAPKRQRLCSDIQDPSPSKEVQQSPFFACSAPQGSPLVEKKARNKKSKRAEFDVWSDDSVDDVLLGLPDVQQTASPLRNQHHIDHTPISSGKEMGQPLNSVPQSSPPNDISYPSLRSVEESPDDSAEREQAESSNASEDLEPFEDLLESHIRMHNDSLLKSFTYQSPSKRDGALKSLSPVKQIHRHSQTFTALSPGKQLAALSSLPKSGAVDAVCGEVVAQGIFEKDQQDPSLLDPQRRCSSSLQNGESGNYDTSESELQTHRPTTATVKGSEDALIPDSEDEGSDIAGSPSQTSTLNLKAFTYVAV